MPSVVHQVDKTSPVPVYHQISDDLISRIIAGEWLPGDRLPSELEFTEAYQVSRVTLRQALAELERQGIISRQCAKGTFLVRNPSPFVESLNFPTLEYHHSKNVSTILEWRIEQELPAYIHQISKITGDAPYVYVQRLFSSDEKTIGWNQAWFPAILVPNMMEVGLTEGSISATLTKTYGYKIHRIENNIEAVHLKASEATLLGVSYDTPALRIISTHFLPDKRPIEFSCTIWSGPMTRFHFVVEDS